MIHLLGFVVYPLVSSFLGTPAIEPQLWSRREHILRTLTLRVPEQLYIASGGSSSPSSKPALTIPKDAGRTGKESRHKGAAASGGQNAMRVRPQRKFELPPLPPHRDVRQSILQPQFKPDMLAQRELRLPEVFFWNVPGLHESIPKPFVMPGHIVPPTQMRKLDAPPRLELPSSGDLAHPTDANPQIQALLRMSAQRGAMPIQTTSSANPQNIASPDPLPGDPASVLSLTPNPMPLREFLTIPPGNQVAPMRGNSSAGAITAAEGGNGRGGNGTGGNGAGSGTASGTASANSGSGSGAADGSANGSGAGGNSPGSGSGAHAGEGTGSGSGLSFEGIREAALAAAAKTKIIHSPTGVFDVVVQSGDSDTFPESEGVLSGKPIYSAFLQVGARKDWIVQYCIPAEDAPDSEPNGPVVRLGNDAPLTAPFPHVTMRPRITWSEGQYRMIHGIITVEGAFQALHVLGVSDPRENAALLAVLEQWEFRPAMRQGKPVRIEILLAIPGE